MKNLKIGDPYITDNSGELSEQYANLANAYFNESKNIKEKFIELFDRLKEENPNQEIIVETPNGTVTFKIGEANIYEGMGGEIVMDSE